MKNIIFYSIFTLSFLGCVAPESDECFGESVKFGRPGCFANEDIKPNTLLLYSVGSSCGPIGAILTISYTPVIEGATVELNCRDWAILEPNVSCTRQFDSPSYSSWQYRVPDIEPSRVELGAQFTFNAILTAKDGRRVAIAEQAQIPCN